MGYGANIDAEDRELWTPLHASAACENFSMVQYLVDNGADVAAINADGSLPVDLVEEDQELKEYLHDEMNSHGKLFFFNSEYTVYNGVPEDLLLSFNISCCVD